MAHNTIDPRLLTQNVHPQESVDGCLMSIHDHAEKVDRLEPIYTMGEGDPTQYLNAHTFHNTEPHFFHRDTSFQTTSAYPFDSQSDCIPLPCLPLLDGTSSISGPDQATIQPVGPQNYPSEIHYGHFHESSPQLVSQPSFEGSIELTGEQSHNLQTQPCTISTNPPALHDSQQGLETQPTAYAFSDLLAKDVDIFFQGLLAGLSEDQLTSFQVLDSMEVDRNSRREIGPSVFHEVDILQSSTWTSGSTIPSLLSLHRPSEIVASVPNSTHISTANIDGQSNWGPTSSSPKYTLSGTGSAPAAVPFPAQSIWDPFLSPENLDMPEEAQILNDMSYLEDMAQYQQKAQGPIHTPSNTPKHFQELVQTPKTDVAPKPFGPSRPISLPLARKGGRKGPLSVEELQKRRESRKQGVCIRCRRLKQKCYGGFPCEACRENPKATLWIYPCVKAQFLDIIECGSYFQDISSFQEALGDKMNPSLLERKGRVMEIMEERNCLNFITAGTSPLARLRGVLSWRAVATTFVEIWNWCEAENSTWTAQHLAEAPARLMSKLAFPPLLFRIPGSSEDRKTWMFRQILICSLPCTAEPLKHEDFACLNKEGLVDVYKNIQETFVWFTKRYSEIALFRYLQTTADRLSWMSGNEQKHAADEFLYFLECGLEFGMPDIGIDLGPIAGVNGSTQQVLEPCLDRKRRLREALFVYFRIALGKLPALSGFWEERKKVRGGITFPESLNSPGASLQVLDTQRIAQFQKALTNYDSWIQRRGKVLMEIRELPVDVKEQLAKRMDSMDTQQRSALFDRIAQIMSGDLRPEVEEIVEILRTKYEPRSEAAKQLTSVLHKMPEVSGLLQEFVEGWKAISGDIIQQFEKVLVEERHIRGDNAKYDEIQRRITKVERFMACAD